jgi:uncharacterized membrane protein YoaK (UPF0700 family)
MRTKHDMKTLKVSALVLLASIAGAALVTVSAQQATFRDDRGRTTGTAATTGNMTTYRDSSGRTTGTGTVDSAGTTTFRDDRGRTIGTATAPRGRR